MSLVTVYTSSATNANSDAGSSYRININPTLGGRRIKVTFETSIGNVTNLIAKNCSVGIATGTNYDTTTTPVEIKFGGASGFNISGGSTRIESDLTDVGASFVSGSKNLIVIIDWDGTSGGTQMSSQGAGDTNVDWGFYSGQATFSNASPGAPTSNQTNQTEAIRFVKVAAEDSILQRKYIFTPHKGPSRGLKSPRDTTMITTTTVVTPESFGTPIFFVKHRLIF